jgi:P-type Ca2+ transporter type 2C
MNDSTLTATAPEEGDPATAWHALSSQAAAARLAVDPGVGLSAEDAAQRLAQHGPNALTERAQRHWARLFLDQFRDFMILVLIAAGVIAGMVGEPQDALAIVVIVLLNGVIGFVQELRAERAIAALKRLAAAHAQVLRDGTRRDVAAAELVPGDVVLLEAGNVVPADVRLVEAAQLKVDESALTGESQAVEKVAERELAPATGVAERANMAYKGTTVVHGRARGVAVATGMTTELGKIAALLSGDVRLKTPLQKRLADFGRRLALAVLVICVVIFAAGMMRGEPALLMLLTAVSLAVAAIPEALPAVVTVLLALGARKLVQHNALIRRLPAVETLGSVTFICSDKTGTLTQNRMQVLELHCGDAVLRAADDWTEPAQQEPWRTLFAAMVLNNDAGHAAAAPPPNGAAIGEPTELALLAAAGRAGVTKSAAEQALPRLMEWPFDAERKRMTTLHRRGDGFIAYTKGAPESVIERCAHDTADFALTRAHRMAASGLRVLAVAQRRWATMPAPTADADHIERELVLIGLMGLADPPRPEALAAVRDCKRAGIVPVMITGDHPTTARAIAEQLEIYAPGDRLLSGAELAALDDETFADSVDHVRVYARVVPEQKIRIVAALQARGQFVAMTGDGVNDAPALQRADIGVAMGRGGTDVAREASALVLLDDNFATIVAAVREGRRIYDNIRKFVRYTMTSNAAEIWAIALAPLFGMPIPLLPIHILWINLVTDGLPGLALAAEPAERGVMQRSPRAPTESVFAHGLWQHVVWVGLLMGGVSLATQAWALQTGVQHWQTMVFTVLTLSQMGHVLAVRSERDSLFTQGLLSNAPVLGAVALTFALQMATVYVPVLQPIFKTQPLSAGELALCLALSAVVFVAVEAEKALVRRGLLYRAGPPAG